ncbi:MAG: hypothetical protein FWD82_10660 [Defluviitaleaceae bacterium]|nr:hypothetical protein [Defluviitaleaceae bacterium]
MDFNYNKKNALCFYIFMFLVAVFFFGGNSLRDRQEGYNSQVAERDINVVNEQINTAIGQASNMLVIMERNSAYSNRETNNFRNAIERTRDEQNFNRRFSNYENMMDIAFSIAFESPVPNTEDGERLIYFAENISSTQRIIRQSDYYRKALDINTSLDTPLIMVIQRVRRIHPLPTFN